MKKFFILLGIVAMTATAYGQADTDIVDIPDPRFKVALLDNTNINTNGDNEISYGEARAYTRRITVEGRKISNLKGIEAFVNITELYCENNRLTSLDISRNTALTSVNCANNQLTSLDISKHTALEYLYCINNKLTRLDVSKNTKLRTLICYSNQLTSLDVSENTDLKWLSCHDNQLTQLNLANGNNTKLFFMKATNNNNLRCIQMDSNSYPKSDWEKDTHARYSDNCNYPTLSTNENNLAKEIKVINPVKDNLIIKTDAKVEHIEIYNTAGQLVKVLFKGNTNVQDLTKGIYLIKITTDQGVRTEKIIK